MPSLSHLIGEAIIAKLETIDGITVRWFDANDPGEGVAYLVLATDAITGRTSNGVLRTLSGHVGFTYATETEEGAVPTLAREAVDELVASMQSALFELETELAVVPDNEFSLTSLGYGGSGETGGEFTVRLDWECRYTHAARDVREPS